MADSLDLMRTVNLVKQFKKGPVVLNGITETIKQGEKVCIIGPSGGGKSTFLKCLNRLETPTSGEIWYKDKLVNGPHTKIDKIRAEIGMVFQQFNLFNNKTVRENITLAPVMLKRMTQEQADEKAMQLLKRIGLEDKANVYPSTLSGGQQQRVAITRALAMEPKIMLFDEPTSALDPEMVGEVLEFIHELADDGMTMVIVTHEIPFAREVSTRILFMDEGVFKESAPPDEFFGNPRDIRLKEFLSKVL